MDLLTHAMNDRMKAEAPLAARMRPRNLAEYIGQEHIIGPGKTTLAPALYSTPIANTTKQPYFGCQPLRNPLHCHRHEYMHSKADLREVIEKAQERRKLYGQKTILFVKDVLETLNCSSTLLSYEILDVTNEAI